MFQQDSHFLSLSSREMFLGEGIFNRDDEVGFTGTLFRKSFKFFVALRRNGKWFAISNVNYG